MTCPLDCKGLETCGADPACGPGENCNNCPGDCDPCCGNGLCEEGYGEDCETCPDDCGLCAGECGSGECDWDETCESCPGDCGACENVWCSLFGDENDELSCLITLAAEDDANPHATALEFEINFDGAALEFVRFHDENCTLIPGLCIDWDTPPQGSIQPTGHALTYQELVAGKIKVVIYHGFAPTTPITEAYLDNDAVEGDADVVELVFKLSENIAENNAEKVDLTGLKASDAEANALCVIHKSGLLVTSESCVEVCGDGLCLGGETCQTCPQDCGACPAFCGDDQCNGNETCGTCPADCGLCPSCPDGECNGAETCESCPEDCDPCLAAETCTVSGIDGSEASCTLKLAADSQASPFAAGAEFVFNFDAAAVTFVRFHDENCDLLPGQCIDWDIPPQGTIEPSGHALVAQEQDLGKMKVLLYHASAPETPITEAYFQVGELQGDAAFVDLVFLLNQNISPDQPLLISFSDLKATAADASPLNMAVVSGIFVTSQ